MSRLSEPGEPKGSWQELMLAPRGTWMNVGEPYIGVGIGLEKLPQWSEDASDWEGLVAATEALDAWTGFTDRGRIFRIVRARPLVEFLDQADSLNAQAELAVRWANDALSAMLAVDL